MEIQDKTSSSGEQGKVDDDRYVHLIGRSLIGTDRDGNFTITLLDAERQPIKGALPITLSKDPFELVNMYFVAGFEPATFNVYKPTLDTVTHSIAEIGIPNELFNTCMTSTDPPCNNMVQIPTDPDLVLTPRVFDV